MQARRGPLRWTRVCRVSILAFSLGSLATLSPSTASHAEVSRRVHGETEAELRARREVLKNQLAAISQELHACDTALLHLHREHASQLQLPLGMLSAMAVSTVVTSFLLLSTCFTKNLRHSSIPDPKTGSSQNLDASADLWEESHAVLMEHVRAGLETERYANLSCVGLLMNRPWLDRPAGKVPTSPALTPISEWLDGDPYFLTSVKDGQKLYMWSHVFSFVYFMWRKKQPYFCVALKVFEGCCAPAIAQLTGKIINEIKPDGDMQSLFSKCCVLFALNLLMIRSEFLFQVHVPAASVRHHLSMRLQRHFLGMLSKNAIAWPPGRCSAMLHYDVPQAVNLVWVSLFHAVQSVTRLTVLLSLMLYNSTAESVHLAPMAITFTMLIVGTLLCGRLRRANMVDLSRRKRDWELIWTNVSVVQLTDNRLHNAATGDSFDELSRELGDAMLISRKRGFHYFFMRLVSAILPSEMAFLAQAAVAFIAGCQVMSGVMSVGEAVILIGLVKLLAEELSSWVKIQLDIMEGYASLLGIVQVFQTDAS